MGNALLLLHTNSKPYLITLTVLKVPGINFFCLELQSMPCYLLWFRNSKICNHARAETYYYINAFSY
jgi:hypothetical protein